VIARSNQFSGSVPEGMFEEEVRHEIEAASFKVGSIVNGWSSRNQQFNGVVEGPRVKGTRVLRLAATDDASGRDILLRSGGIRWELESCRYD
jgi:hypothetical protein